MDARPPNALVERSEHRRTVSKIAAHINIQITNVAPDETEIGVAFVQLFIYLDLFLLVSTGSSTRVDVTLPMTSTHDKRQRSYYGSVFVAHSYPPDLPFFRAEPSQQPLQHNWGVCRRGKPALCALCQQ